ncbi:MAG: hypothetical protein V5B36_14030 [Candidatus Accumulibacter sp. UW25]|jgi:hypothetical protein
MLTLTIMPDFGEAYCWRSEGDEADRLLWVGACSGLPMVRKGTKLRAHPLAEEFIEWQSDFESLSMKYDEWEKFDWRSFHREGIRLARKLKSALGDTYRIIYEKPIEDPSNRYNERREILLDGTLKTLISRREIAAAIRATKSV